MADFDDLKDREYPDSITEEDTNTEENAAAEKTGISESKLDPSQFLMAYAGPGFFNVQQKSMFQMMNEAKEEPVMEDVYAGPGMMGELGFEEPVEEKPERPRPMPDPQMMAVYAGPSYWNPTPAKPDKDGFTPNMMFVYAAPPLANPRKDGTRKFCTECGSPLREGYKFCPECGYRIPGSDGGGIRNV